MFLILRGFIGFQRTYVEMSQKALYIYGTIAHFIVVFDIIAVTLIFSNTSVEKGYIIADSTYYICTFNSYGHTQTFAGFGLCIAIFDALFLLVLLYDFAKRISKVRYIYVFLLR